MDKGLLALLIGVGIFAGGLWGLKAGVRALIQLSLKAQYGILSCIAATLAIITPAGFLNAFAVYALLILGGWTWILKKVGGFKRNNDGPTVLRGNQLVDVREVQKLVAGEESTVSIGQVHIPRRLEVSHFLFCGTTRSGKSQAFLGLMTPIRAKGERCIVGDVGGEFCARFYSDGDVILNPFDARSVSWSPLAEMQGEWDAERIAKSICPSGEGSAAEWNGYAQTLIAAVLAKLWATDGNNGELMCLLTQASHSELKDFVHGTPAVGLFADGNERMLGSILGIVASKVKSFQYLDPAAGIDAFSIRKFVKNESTNWLFLSYTDSQYASLQPILCTMLDVAISACLELKPDQNRRCWFMLDELASYGHLSSLRSLLEKGAKYGAPCVVGLQAPQSQLREAYGHEAAQTILANLGTQLVLRSPDGESADYLSRIFGEQDIQRVNHSTSSNGSDVSHSQSVSYSTQRVIMPAEIQGLPNLVGYLNVVGDTPPCVVNIPIIHGEEVAERFVAKQRRAKTETAEPIPA